MNFTFLLTHIPDPRLNKRIAAAAECGAVSVLCVRRKSQNIWEPYHTKISHIILDIDLPSASSLFKRGLYSMRFIKQAKIHLRNLAPDVIYCEGLDTLIIACDYCKNEPKTKIIYEVADLREIYITRPQNIFGKVKKMLLESIEHRCLPQISGLVVTSEKFYEVHYQRFVSQGKKLFLPNIPDHSAFDGYNKKRGGTFTVGFIGGIRYLTQMKLLVDAAEQCGVRVLFAGAGVNELEYKDITTYCKDKSFVRFIGKYQYDREIAGLYGMVDCVYAVYDADNPNVRIALPNKLYEAIYCELPLLVAKGTYLAEEISRLGVGIAVNHKDKQELSSALSTLANDQWIYEKYIEKCREAKYLIDPNIYHQKLIETFLME